jgi:hypothetical protein
MESALIARPLWNSFNLLARFSVYVSTLFGLKKKQVPPDTRSPAGQYQPQGGRAQLDFSLTWLVAA